MTKCSLGWQQLSVSTFLPHTTPASTSPQFVSQAAAEALVERDWIVKMGLSPLQRAQIRFWRKRNSGCMCTPSLLAPGKLRRNWTGEQRMLHLWGSETQEQRVPPAASTGACLAAFLLWQPLPQPCQFPSDYNQAKKGNNTPNRLVATRGRMYQTGFQSHQRRHDNNKSSV